MAYGGHTLAFQNGSMQLWTTCVAIALFCSFSPAQSEGVLYMLQTRVGKRTGTAAMNMATDMLKEKMINEKMAVMRVKPEQLDELLHPIVDPVADAVIIRVLKGIVPEF